MIVILGLGIGNVGSIANMLRKVGAPGHVSARPKDVEAAQGIILPGVGAFDRGMRNLLDSGLVPLLEDKVLEMKTPLLGICLGMQLLTRSSEEGQLAGLGWIAGSTHRFRMEDKKVPHMGWNRVQQVGSSSLFDGIQDPRFYFLHSYYVRCEDRDQALGSTEYGTSFDSAVGKENILGVQFHPEKSHRFGMKLLRNFATLAA